MTAKPALLVAALMLFVASCGGNDNSSGEAAPAATATPTASPTATASAEADSGESAANKSKDEQAAEEAGGKSCAEAGDVSGEPKLKPPADLSVPQYAHLYKSEGPFGKTTRFYAVMDGGPEDLPARRDDLSSYLVQSSGYAQLSTDQEEGIEAEAHLKGTDHDIDLQVINLCKGKLRIRYTVQ
jgi:hypothetical protein